MRRDEIIFHPFKENKSVESRILSVYPSARNENILFMFQNPNRPRCFLQYDLTYNEYEWILVSDNFFEFFRTSFINIEDDCRSTPFRTKAHSLAIGDCTWGYEIIQLLPFVELTDTAFGGPPCYVAKRVINGEEYFSMITEGDYQLECNI